MDITEQEAEAFIAAQKARFEECGVTGMTRRQRARVKALNVISPEDRAFAFEYAAGLTHLGHPPHGDTGRMRVVNMLTGEIREQRAPKLKIDFDLDDEPIAEVIV